MWHAYVLGQSLVEQSTDNKLSSLAGGAGCCSLRCWWTCSLTRLQPDLIWSVPGLQALFCQVPAENVLTMHDVSNIWRIPLLMQSQNAHKTILEALKLPHYAEQLDMHAWKTSIADRYGATGLLIITTITCVSVRSSLQRPEGGSVPRWRQSFVAFLWTGWHAHFHRPLTLVAAVCNTHVRRLLSMESGGVMLSAGGTT